MKTTTAPHQLDSMFDLVPGQTEVMIPGRDETEQHASEDIHDVTELTVQADSEEETAVGSYDSKDNEIEGELDGIHERAIEAYETMVVAAQTVVDKKYAARNAEVAAVFLQIALNATKEKNSTKDRKDKIVASRKSNQTATTPSSVTNNIVTDRETAMKLLREGRSGS